MPRSARVMPRPVEALPCGSRSITSTLRFAASAVARLIAVVVLPTPPFWLARAMMRGPWPRSGAGTVDVAQAEDDGCGVGAALIPLGGHFPIVEGGGQLAVGGAAFREESDAVRGEE